MSPLDAGQKSADIRNNRLRGLRNNVGQASAWQMQLLDIVEELAHENKMLRRAVVELRRDVAALRGETVAT